MSHKIMLLGKVLALYTAGLLVLGISARLLETVKKSFGRHFVQGIILYPFS